MGLLSFLCVPNKGVDATVGSQQQGSIVHIDAK
jgi:hypothetical protein